MIEQGGLHWYLGGCDANHFLLNQYDDTLIHIL